MQVADDAEVAELEDRRVRVLVDRDDHARALHADLVLDRARDAARRRRASATTVLPVWPTWVEYGYQPASTTARVAATAPPSALRELLDEREVLRAAEAAAAGDDHVRVLDRRPLGSSCACSTIVAAVEKSWSSTGALLDARPRRRSRPGRTRPERKSAMPRRRSSSRRRRAPCPERRPLADELPVLAATRSTRSQFRPGVEPRREAGGDVRGEHRRWRRARCRSRSLAHELREHVDARLRQRRLERRVVGDVDLLRAERAGLGGERRCTPEPTTTPATSSPSEAAFESTPSEPFWSSPSWCSRKTSVRHSSFFSARKSTIFCAAAAVVLDLHACRRAAGDRRARAPRSATRPRRAASRRRRGRRATAVSCGFFFAPMIPFSDG